MVHLLRLTSLDHKRDLSSLLQPDQMMMNTTTRRQRAERNPVRADRAIRQDDDLDALFDSVARLSEDAIQRALIAGKTLALGEGDVDGLTRPFLVAGLEVLHRVHLGDGEDGTGEEDTVTLLGLHLEEVALWSDVGLERHDDVFSDGIDGRVGDLREELAEVVVNEARLGGHAGERSVVTHTAQRLLPFGDHRKHEEIELLDAVAEREEDRVSGESVLIDDGVDVDGSLDALEDIGDLDHLILDPAGEVLLPRRRPLQLLIVDDAALDRVDEQHTTRLQATLLDDLLGLDVDRADLGSADHDVLAGDDVSTRTKTISVEIGTTVSAIAEREQCRTVPSFLKTRRPLVERLLLGVHELVVLPRLGDKHHNSFGKRHDAIDDEKLKDVVEGC